ncbi:hypothetical protein RB195_012484 [Necator americanus]|uniref:Uncharacterized protein n=1 Tax=Necator americanus TaxID=51031 RepID=A0ABR1D7B1_NECAM
MMQFFLDLFSLSWVLSVRPSTNSTPFDVFFFCEFTKCPITSAAEYMKLHSISSNFSFVVRVLFEGLCIGTGWILQPHHLQGADSFDLEAAYHEIDYAGISARKKKV